MEIVPQYKMLLEEVEDIEIEDDNDRGEKVLVVLELNNF